MIIQRSLPYRQYKDPDYISVTTYTGCWPKGKGMTTYLLNETPESSRKKLREAGNRGSRVHDTIEMILTAKDAKGFSPQDYRDYWKDPLLDHQRSYKMYLSDYQLIDEWKMIEAFYNWYLDYGQPKPLAVEIRCDSKDLQTSGRIDTIFEIKGRKVIVDWKTGSSKADEYYHQDSKGKQVKNPSTHVHYNHKIQQAAYWYGVEEDRDKDGNPEVEIDMCMVVCLNSGHRTQKELKDLETRHTGIGYECVPILRNERVRLIKDFKICKHLFHFQNGWEFDPKAGQVELLEDISIIHPLNDAS